MSGPIVRSGPSAAYTKNWDAVFGTKPAKTKKKVTGETAKAKPAKKKKK
jgi:hypothetical protein